MEAANLINLLPGQVPGYVLRSRKWVQLDAASLQWTLGQGRDSKQSADEAGWKDLVLPPGHKDIILAMVQNHTASSNVLKNGVRQVLEVDLVKGKGDIAYQPDVVGKNLDRLFYLAHRWSCVLLLDEADVFLAKRSKEDIKRNGLVSIFLRTLEYYPGILFLTTNRVGMIDDAFRSRLHLTLYYPRLDRAQSKKVWKVNLRRLTELNADRQSRDLPKVHIDRDKILKYADLNFDEMRWNGRQIRNAFQSALALADFKAQDTGRAPTLSAEQFEVIAKASHDFDVTHGFDEDKMAQRDRTRGAYKHSESSRKLKSLPLSSSSQSSSSDADDDDSDKSSSGSDSDSGSDSAARKRRSKKKKRKDKEAKKTARSKKHKKDAAKSEKKKGKEKEKAKREYTDESDDSSDDGDD
ncbi:hypothetical protein GGR52DRAFT_570671 [Hypoxylon sp. FL1284]|nr:hypothetical protein GGR52DRAFT_570671 [Hypoxylon sp. FL1284]